MYRCTKCKQVVPAGQSAHLVAGDVRLTTYRERPNQVPFKGKGKKRVWRDDPGGRGWEVTRMEKVCSGCAKEAEAHLAQRLAELGVE